MKFLNLSVIVLTFGLVIALLHKLDQIWQELRLIRTMYFSVKYPEYPYLWVSDPETDKHQTETQVWVNRIMRASRVMESKTKQPPTPEQDRLVPPR